MEIKNLNSRIISAYKGINPVSAKGGKGKPEASGKTGDNFDKIEFDFGRSTEVAKTDITTAVAADAGAARIGQLQTAYEGEKLPVTAQQIADSILG
jgi:hypothetical protein